jgi:hypothetical protein
MPDKEAAYTLGLMMEQNYNTYRPDSAVIEDLIKVCIYLTARIAKLEYKCRKLK